jgi:Protein of unknown function (DUF1761)
VWLSWTECLGCTCGRDLGLSAGGLWYAPFLFGGAWKRANVFGADEPLPAGAKVFVISFILSLVMALNLAVFLNDPKTNLVWGATAGFLAGFGWVVMGVGIVSLFERRPWSYVWVNGGYLTLVVGRGGQRGLEG